ncbi:Oxido UcpA [Cyphellophora attinorum]|uniref:Oxido UcpA n=1 Tax=Cyphellophora attinorum TaxID=1664694 RepID=A0A0N0NHR1_9EURO|nr:Oxido UcpA [Phialophora attinorum]KPI34858.1 Oxido UcpA [Phialophora attinorum]
MSPAAGPQPDPFTTLTAQEAPFPSFTKIWHRNSYPAISPTAPAQSAQGKTVLITGGGGSIGAATARSFAVAGAAHIAILGRTESSLLDTKEQIESRKGNKTRVWTFVCDVFDQAAVDKTFVDFERGLKAESGENLSIDVLVLNAGYCKHKQPLTGDMPVDEWMLGITGNLTGPLVVTRAFLRYVRSEEDRKAKGLSPPVVINVSSCASFIVMMPGISAYSVGKAAGAVLMQHLQLEYPDMRVVSIQPGGPDSEMQRDAGVKPMDHVSLPGDFNVWLAGKEADFLKGKYVFANWDVEEMIDRKQQIVEDGLLESWLSGVPRAKMRLEMKSGDTIDA